MCTEHTEIREVYYLIEVTSTGYDYSLSESCSERTRIPQFFKEIAFRRSQHTTDMRDTLCQVKWLCQSLNLQFKSTDARIILCV